MEASFRISLSKDRHTVYVHYAPDSKLGLTLDMSAWCPTFLSQASMHEPCVNLRSWSWAENSECCLVKGIAQDGLLAKSTMTSPAGKACRIRACPFGA